MLGEVNESTLRKRPVLALAALVVLMLDRKAYPTTVVSSRVKEVVVHRVSWVFPKVLMLVNVQAG